MSLLRGTQRFDELVRFRRAVRESPGEAVELRLRLVGLDPLVGIVDHARQLATKEKKKSSQRGRDRAEEMRDCP